jgi:outer membrane lipoprotein LolB
VIRALLAAICIAGLAGCATPPRADDSGDWTSGRLSLRVEATPERPAQSMNAAFELRGSSQQGELRLVSPLGTQLAAARWQPGVVLLTTPEGEQRFATLEALSRQALGEAVPLAALPDWLAGRPWPEAPHRPGPEGFEQLGWQVQTQRRAEGWVSARRATPPVVELRVRLELSQP